MPANFQQEFHFSQILPPDVGVLSRVILAALGCAQGTSLSRKLSLFFKLAKVSAAAVEHSLFTSSALIALLKGAQARLRSLPEQGEKDVSGSLPCC